MNSTDCVVSSSPNAETARITERGPKNTKPYVAIASASHARKLTNKQSHSNYHIKDSDWFLIQLKKQLIMGYLRIEHNDFRRRINPKI